ncbi:MAG: DUF2384 domain-containing protein [Nitrospirae bacterium]|nr:DUF2384 domain-containing protein [Nitrospirota bacterium]MCL5021902.1 DUF2384 domain-containing protein [Nitrospirota bacterium]
MTNVASILGGDRILGRKIKGDFDFDALIRKGIPLRVVSYVKKKFALSDGDIARVIGLSSRTLSRRLKIAKTWSSTLRKTEHAQEPGRNPSVKLQRLSLVESDRLYRFARIVARAQDVFADERAAIEWLNSPQYGLGECIPLDLLKTDAGAQEVVDLLGRIEYGVIS